MLGEALAVKILRLQPEALQIRAHRSVEDQDALGQFGVELRETCRCGSCAAPPSQRTPTMRQIANARSARLSV